jgi:hypothetical protein
MGFSAMALGLIYFSERILSYSTCMEGALEVGDGLNRPVNFVWDHGTCRGVKNRMMDV